MHLLLEHIPAEVIPCPRSLWQSMVGFVTHLLSTGTSEILSYSTSFDTRDFAQRPKSPTNCCGLFEGCSTRDETVAGHAHTGADGLFVSH